MNFYTVMCILIVVVAGALFTMGDRLIGALLGIVLILALIARSTGHWKDFEMVLGAVVGLVIIAVGAAS